MTREASERDIRDVVSGTSFIVAEEIAHLRELTVFALESFGAGDVLEARGGCEAIDLLRVTSADVLVTAWDMWPVDGWMTVDYMRHARHGLRPDLPVIVVAASARAADIVSARRLGVADFLVWPMSAAFLARRVARAVVRARAAERRLPAFEARPGVPSTAPLLTFAEARTLLEPSQDAPGSPR